jgi:SAM-dependent methyltransferase
VNDSKSILPERYSENWRDLFDTLARPGIVPGARILDIGAGRKPTYAPDERPPDVHYAGFDLSLGELQKAPTGSYDEIFAGDAVKPVEALVGKYDVVISYNVLEHIAPINEAIENIRSYLKPGGIFIAQMSGTFSVFGVINKVIPQKIGVWGLKRLLGRNPETVFPAYYDRCYYSGLLGVMAPWTKVTITPRYRGASYFSFSPFLQKTYIRYENWTIKSGKNNLATHYTISAIK